MTSYSSRRASSSYGTRTRGYTNRNAWTQNRNTVRQGAEIKLGPIWSVVTVAIAVALMGFLFVSNSSAVTTYDRNIAEVDGELSALELERDALKIENAKIHAAASTEEGNTVASNMVDAHAAGYVSE